MHPDALWRTASNEGAKAIANTGNMNIPRTQYGAFRAVATMTPSNNRQTGSIQHRFLRKKSSASNELRKFVNDNLMFYTSRSNKTSVANSAVGGSGMNASIVWSEVQDAQQNQDSRLNADYADFFEESFKENNVGMALGNVRFSADSNVQNLVNKKFNLQKAVESG